MSTHPFGNCSMKRIHLAHDIVLPPGDSERNLPPIILLHGMLDTRKTWKTIVPEIAARTGRKVYSLDARNHGDSEWSENFSVDILAQDLDHFMEDAEISKATLIGHSMGGRTALTLALKKPEKVEKLIVEDMRAKNFRPQTGSFFSQFISVLKEALNAIPPGADKETAAKSVMKFLMELMPPEQISGIQEVKYDFSAMMPIKKSADGFYVWQANLDQIAKSVQNMDAFRQDLSGVYMGDSLFLYGTQSPLKVEKDDLIPKLFPKAQVVPIVGADHMMHAGYSTEFLSEVISFINNSPKFNSKY